MEKEELLTSGTKEGSNGVWWQSLISNADGIFGGIGSIVQSATGNYPDVYYVEKEDNTGKYLAIGGVVLVVLIVLIFLLKK
ncbi:hypothetical protein LJC53_05545 [Bacteroidales bacterium OttesenSCG-928-C03]|nr:hypothetical protein [Bacteroidales bacterium OttesenSCG-928-C03]MDL2326744.1 hypothetical protein [Bacteroidales bacterium OttesenSCG-928-A14]